MEVEPDTLMKIFKLSSEDFDKQVHDDHLETLSQDHCGEWRRLPPHLGLKTIVTEDIDRNSAQSEPDKRYTFFTVWKKRKGADATYRALVTALLKIENRHAAECLCKLLKPSSGVTVQTQTSFSETGTDCSTTEGSIPASSNLGDGKFPQDTKSSKKGKLIVCCGQDRP